IDEAAFTERRTLHAEQDRVAVSAANRTAEGPDVENETMISRLPTTAHHGVATVRERARGARHRSAPLECCEALKRWFPEQPQGLGSERARPPGVVAAREEHRGRREDVSQPVCRSFAQRQEGPPVRVADLRYGAVVEGESQEKVEGPLRPFSHDVR